jgi:hypothetical protein
MHHPAGEFKLPKVWALPPTYVYAIKLRAINETEISPEQFTKAACWRYKRSTSSRDCDWTAALDVLGT